MENLSSENQRSFQAIDSALFAVCLDNYSPGAKYETAGRDVFHGINAKNRWFDKAIQLVVFNDGRVGVNGEVFH